MNAGEWPQAREDIELLAYHHQEDGDELGDAARRLLDRLVIHQGTVPKVPSTPAGDDEFAANLMSNA